MGNHNVIVKEGLIYQAISGFYYVWVEGKSIATKPRGKFRHQQMKPLVGDRVEIEIDLNDQQSESRLIKVLPRKNTLVRPSVANVDYSFVVMSLVEPEFSFNLMDYFLVSMECNQIKPIIVLTKYDLLVQQNGEVQAQAIIENVIKIYQSIGYQVVVRDTEDRFKTQIESIIEKGIYIVMGQSGVGKSTLLNQLLPKGEIATGEISSYLNRGRHTTREVTLYQLYGGMLADTPGFSAIDFPELEKEGLSECFPEIWKTSEHCRFRGCLHHNEPGCAVKDAVEEGVITQSRYQNYLQIFEKIKNRKPFYRKKEK